MRRSPPGGPARNEYAERTRGRPCASNPAAEPTARRLRILHLGFEDHAALAAGRLGRYPPDQQPVRPTDDITASTMKWRGCADRTEDASAMC